jgi:hypothetical protein
MTLNENHKLLEMRNESESVLLQRLFRETVGFFEEFDSVQQALATEPAIKFMAANIEGMRQVVIILKDRAGKTPFLDSPPVEAEIPEPPIAPPVSEPKTPRRFRLRIAAALVRKDRRGARSR